MILKHSPGCFLDEITVYYNVKNKKGRYYLSPPNIATENGLIEIKGCGSFNYIINDEDIVFTVYNESLEPIEEMKLTINPPSLKVIEKGRILHIFAYNSKHIFINNGKGRLNPEKIIYFEDRFYSYYRVVILNDLNNTIISIPPYCYVRVGDIL